MGVDAASSSNDLKEEFDAFRARCMHARRLWNLYNTLYGRQENIELLRGVADAFFADIQESVIRLLILEVCALTDRAAMGKEHNLSVERIQKRLEQDGYDGKVTRCLVHRLTAHGERLRPARIKIVAHADLKVVLSGERLGPATDEEWLQWWNDLQAFCDEAGNAIGVGPSDFQAQAEPGDALDLLKFLRSAERAAVSGRPSQRVRSDE